MKTTCILKVDNKSKNISCLGRYKSLF